MLQLIGGVVWAKGMGMANSPRSGTLDLTAIRAVPAFEQTDLFTGAPVPLPELMEQQGIHSPGVGRLQRSRMGSGEGERLVHAGCVQRGRINQTSGLPEVIHCDTSFIGLQERALRDPASVAHWPAEVVSRLDQALLAISIFAIAEIRAGRLYARWVSQGRTRKRRGYRPS